MDPFLLHSPLSSKPTFLTPSSYFNNQPPHAATTRLRLATLRATGPITTTTNNSSNDEDPAAATVAPDTTNTTTPPPPPPPPPPPRSPGTLNIRYRSRKQARQKQQEVTSGSRLLRPPPPKKEWEAMTLGEKAVELYVGEKGLLFWLNKFAYASIFIIIGAWVLFRFVGPNIGLYQLDAPPLSPSNVFKGTGPV